MSSKCGFCAKTVYFAERVSAAGVDYHKLCFKCSSCKKALEPGKFNERDSKLYCQTCYGAQFGDKGFGRGGTSNSFTSFGKGQSEVVTTTAVPSPPTAGAKFCANCGNGVSGAKFCSNCGEKV
eukprot:TRINITY_DN1255_c0_g1_i1.p1 TRINITY_DN1255_c0_g1~~TRINITY_DN1255_c0_g1_i1.p1  ORF type:complete len:123 (+),score=18.72 TRINITY_DN1255_c0_g1_i1:128-496(+)